MKHYKILNKTVYTLIFNIEDLQEKRMRFSKEVKRYFLFIPKSKVI